MPEFATEQLSGREQDAVPFGLRGLCDLRGRSDTGLMGQSDTGLTGQSEAGLMGQSENGLIGQSDSFSFWPQKHSENSDVAQSSSNVNLAMKIGHLYWLRSGPAQLENPPSEFQG